MTDLANLAIGATIVALTGSAALAGVWVGATGGSSTVGMAAITASIVGVGFLVAALDIQIPARREYRPQRTGGDPIEDR